MNKSATKTSPIQQRRFHLTEADAPEGACPRWCAGDHRAIDTEESYSTIEELEEARADARIHFAFVGSENLYEHRLVLGVGFPAENAVKRAAGGSWDVLLEHDPGTSGVGDWMEPVVKLMTHRGFSDRVTLNLTAAEAHALARQLQAGADALMLDRKVR